LPIAELENNNMKNINSKWTSLLAAAFLLGTASVASAVVDTNGDDSFNAAFPRPHTTQVPNSAAGAYAQDPNWQAAPARMITEPRGSRVRTNSRGQPQR
jgi:hypothetical protein